ncbi:ArsA family ATPase [Kineosporia sp. A_224]|uniref:ArsA family ATPase n=1 Tax=Kineosporia sp. A_224 TaxID=1962180 RepID=UPI000B4BD7CB|nr:ArsA family ATPase [Kineosporia sp. A_224]
MRLLLLTGKGGVGKTTVAAATAVHAARCGVKTLVASTDAAHSLGDALAAPVGSTPTEVADGLFAQQVDARARGEQSWREVQEYLIGVLDALGVDPVAAEELTVLPGAEEVLALLEVRDQVRGGPWDLVVLDCAPTAETLRLLALPEALSRYLDRMLPVERRVLRALSAGRGAGTAGRTARRGGVPVPRDSVVEAAERLHAELNGVREVLTDTATSVRLVLTPETVVVAEARRTWTSLALHGYRVDGVVANRVIPAQGEDAWRSGWAAAQAVRLAEVGSSFAPVPVLTVPYAAAEPVGAAALADLGETLYGPAGAASARALLAEPTGEAPLRVERSGPEFVLVLDLPLARREDLELGRRGDDLLVGVGSARRVIALPSALRRCRVVGAHLRDGRLRVRFEPDPELWRPL